MTQFMPLSNPVGPTNNTTHGPRWQPDTTPLAFEALCQRFIATDQDCSGAEAPGDAIMEGYESRRRVRPTQSSHLHARAGVHSTTSLTLYIPSTT